MKETLFLIIFVIVFYIVFMMNGSSLIEVNKNGNIILVRNAVDKQKSVELLYELILRMYTLREYLITNIDNFPEYKEYINLLEVNFNKNRTIIYENNFNSEYTSYSVNKGEELVFCLRCKKDGSLHQINLLMYVAVHEMAHTACPENGHTPLFNKIFKFMLEQAVNINLYIYEDYSRNPVEYCGMNLHTNILNGY
jgi:predicted metal-dependent hydrolase